MPGLRVQGKEQSGHAVSFSRPQTRTSRQNLPVFNQEQVFRRCYRAILHSRRNLSIQLRRPHWTELASPACLFDFTYRDRCTSNSVRTDSVHLDRKGCKVDSVIAEASDHDRSGRGRHVYSGGRGAWTPFSGTINYDGKHIQRRFSEAR
jgi:hypothetical protein